MFMSAIQGITNSHCIETQDRDMNIQIIHQDKFKPEVKLNAVS